MHYVCLHYEFEHDPTDPDEVCEARACPSGALFGGREQAAATALMLPREADLAAGWENDTVGTYPEAVAAWLSDADGFYLKVRSAFRRRPVGDHHRRAAGGNIYE